MKRQPRDPYRDNLVNRRWVSSSHSLLGVVGGQQQTSWTSVYLLMRNVVNDLHGLGTKPEFPFLPPSMYVNDIHINWQTFNAEILARSAQITLCESYQDTLKSCNVRFMIIVNLYCYGRRRNFKFYHTVLCECSCKCVCVMCWIMEICTCAAFMWLLIIGYKVISLTSFLHAVYVKVMCMKIQRHVLWTIKT